MSERLVDRSDNPGLRPDITYAGINRGIDFILGSEGEAKSAAVAAMDTIYPDADIREEIAQLDLNQGQGRLSWDYYGLSALKTTIDFDQEDEGWKLRVSKVFSEGTSLRERIEQEVGRPSLPARASISLEFATPEEGGQYMEAIGIKHDPEQLGQEAQEQAYFELRILLRNLVASRGPGATEILEGWPVDRPEDMSDVVVEFAEQSDRDMQGKVLERLLSSKERPYWRGSYGEVTFRYKGSEEVSDAMQDEDFDPVAALRMIFDMRKNRYELGGLHPGSFVGGNLDALEVIYKDIAKTSDEKARLYDALFLKTKQRVESDGLSMPQQLTFGKSQDPGQMNYPRELSASLSVPVNDERVVAGLSAYFEGSFDLEARTFTPSSLPQKFALSVHASDAYRRVADKNIQALINVTASVLALQKPDFLSSRMGSTDDSSHFWAMDTLGQTLIGTSDPHLQRMGGIVLDKRFGTDTLYG